MKKVKSFTKEMKKRLSTDVKGFTLIEVIVVLVILAILMAIAIPNVLGYINKAKGTENEAMARSIYLAANVESAQILKNKMEITSTDFDFDVIDNIYELTNIDKSGFTITSVNADPAEASLAANNAMIVVNSGAVQKVIYCPSNYTTDNYVTYLASGGILTGDMTE